MASDGSIPVAHLAQRDTSTKVHKLDTFSIWHSENSNPFPRQLLISFMKGSVAALFSLALLVVSKVEGHSHLASPLPGRKLFCRAGNGINRNCYGPCPPNDSYGSPTDINAENVAETWKRGEKRYVSWHKNNHGGNGKGATGATGFTRLALVPVDQMMSKDAHQKGAFWYTCWGVGETRCPSKEDIVCGNDKGGDRYGTTVTVPRNYKDGVYVFGWVWYGAGVSGKSYFGEYVF